MIIAVTTNFKAGFNRTLLYIKNTSNWILGTNFWVDSSLWDDTETWND